MRLRNGKLIGGESHLIEEMDPQALLNQIQYMINGVEERMERRLERLKNLIGERDEHDFKVPHHRPRNVNNNRRIEEEEKLVNKVMLNMKTKAPIFDGDLDPTVYMDELREMDGYFEWFRLS